MLSKMTMWCIPNVSCCRNELYSTVLHVAQARAPRQAMAPKRLQWDMLADDTWAQIASHLDTRDKMVRLWMMRLCMHVMKAML